MARVPVQLLSPRSSCAGLLPTMWMPHSRLIQKLPHNSAWNRNCLRRMGSCSAGQPSGAVPVGSDILVVVVRVLVNGDGVALRNVPFNLLLVQVDAESGGVGNKDVAVLDHRLPGHHVARPDRRCSPPTPVRPGGPRLRHRTHRASPASTPASSARLPPCLRREPLPAGCDRWPDAWRSRPRCVSFPPDRRC